MDGREQQKARGKLAETEGNANNNTMPNWEIMEEVTEEQMGTTMAVELPVPPIDDSFQPKQLTAVVDPDQENGDQLIRKFSATVNPG
jgi:hypothetical protein